MRARRDGSRLSLRSAGMTEVRGNEGRAKAASQVTISFNYFRFVVIGLTALAVLAPLSLVFYQSFLTAPFFQPAARLSLNAYAFVLSDPEFWSAFATTVLVAAGMALIAVPLGAVLAFLMVRTDVPGREWLEPVILVPIFVSAVVIAFGYVVALGPVGFLTNKLGVPSYQLMAVVVVAIVAVTAPLVFMQRILLKQAQRYVSVRGKGLKATPLKLGPWRWPAFAAIALWFAITVLIPIAGITLRSFVEFWGEGVALSEVLTLAHYRELFEYPNVVRAMINTFGIGVIGGAIAVVG